MIPEKNWLLGIEKPVGVAYSELQNIKKYIIIVCLISITMVSLFSWLAIHKIIQPYYRDVEALNAKLAASVKKLSTLHKVSRSISQILPVEEMLEHTIKGIAEALGYERIMLYLTDEGANRANLKMALIDGDLSAPESMPEEARSLEINLGNGILERAIIEQRPYVIRGAQSSDKTNKERLKILGILEFAAVPLVAEGRSIGVISVDNPTSAKPIKEEDVDTLVTFADRVAPAIESARLHSALQVYATDLATTDSLTGLSNQVHFAEWLEEEIDRSRLENKPLSLLLAQAESLKNINEKFGYSAGNKALRQFGQIIAALLGENEVGARFGGGDFVIGLSSGSENRARELAGEVKENAKTFQLKEAGLEKVSLSVHVCFGSLKEDETAQDFLERIRKLGAMQGEA